MFGTLLHTFCLSVHSRFAAELYCLENQGNPFETESYVKDNKECVTGENIDTEILTSFSNGILL